MTTLQKLRTRHVAIGRRLNEIAGVEDALTDEVRAEHDALQLEYRDVATKLEAAEAADPDPTVTRTDPTMDTETRERLELRGRVNLGAFLTAALGGRVVNGAEAEYAAAFNAPSGHIPIDLWEQDRPRAEERAATPAPTTGPA